MKGPARRIHIRPPALRPGHRPRSIHILSDLSAKPDQKPCIPRVSRRQALTIVTIPLTYSIATGLSFGLISYAVLELATGRGMRQHWMLYLLAVLFLLRFMYIA